MRRKYKADKSTKHLKKSRSDSASPSGFSSNTYYRSSQRVSKSKRENNNAPNNGLRSSIVTSPKKLVSKVISGLIIVMIIWVAYLATTVSPSSSEVTVRDGSYEFRDKTVYSAFVNEYISSNVLARSKLLFPISDFNQAFVNQFPEVSAINTNVPVAGRDVSIVITTPEPLFQIASSVTSNEFVRYLDSNGTVIETSKSSSAIPTLTVDRNDIINPGDRLLTENEVEIIQLLKNEINASNISGLPDGFSIKAASLNVLDGRLEIEFSGVGYFVRFSGYGDSRNQVGALKATLTELYASNAGNDRTLQLPKSYIDVRVFEKVFVN